MRKLAHVASPAQAASLAAVLQSEGIACEVRDQADGLMSVWVLEERDLQQARALHDTWLTHPPEDNSLQTPTEDSSPEPAPSSATPATIAQAAPAPAAARPRGGKQPRGVYLSFRLRLAGAPLTKAILIASAVVAVTTGFGTQSAVLRHLMIAADFGSPGHAYDQLRAGELWRLLTPALVHFGVLHLLFNGFWMLDLSAAIERTWGSRQLALLFAFSAVLSNLGQLHFGQSAAFGGLSGVVYACLGYIWARGRFDPGSPIGIPTPLMRFFIVYLALGFSGLLDDLFGKMANYCHLGGLLAGVAYGWLMALLKKQRLRRSTQA